jgi:hypothetical protein
MAKRFGNRFCCHRRKSRRKIKQHNHTFLMFQRCSHRHLLHFPYVLQKGPAPDEASLGLRYPGGQPRLPTESCRAGNQPVHGVDHRQRASGRREVDVRALVCLRVWGFGDANEVAQVEGVGDVEAVFSVGFPQDLVGGTAAELGDGLVYNTDRRDAERFPMAVADAIGPRGRIARICLRPAARRSGEPPIMLGLSGV